MTPQGDSDKNKAKGQVKVRALHYDIIHVMPLLLPLLLISASLVILGAYLIIHAISRIRHYDHLIAAIKKKYSLLSRMKTAPGLG